MEGNGHGCVACTIRSLILGLLSIYLILATDSMGILSVLVAESVKCLHGHLSAFCWRGLTYHLVSK